MISGRVFVFVAPFVVACVNNGDDTSGKSPGTLGGPCFANNTCNSGLTCALENGSGVCEASDATLDAPVLDTGNDVTTPGDAGDAGVDADAACNVTEAPNLLCNASCLNQPDAGGGCCPKYQACIDQPVDCPSLPTWSCQSRADCSNVPCCISATVTPGCPPSITFSTTEPGAVCASSAACMTDQVALCSQSSDCPNQTCVGVENLTISGSVGVCM